MRQAALYLATTGWVLTVLLNASPFMRFDGYFILSDVLDFPNLHERAGAHARVWLRHHLLGLDDPWPEPFAARTRRALVAFAFSTWLYRLLLFLGIAWAVYAFFFKALGIFLMLVEITWFILKPIWSELSVWKKRWKQVSVGRRTRLWLVLLTSGVLLALPWRMDIVTTGVAHAERQQLVFAPFPARLVEIRTTGPVEEGAVLARFDTPDLAVRESQAWTAAGNLEQRLSGLIELREEGRKQELALTGRLREQQAEARAVSEERGRLHIPAGFSGIWLDTDFALKPGVWLSVHEPLGVLIDPSNWVVDAYVDQRLVPTVYRSGRRRAFYRRAHFLRYRRRCWKWIPRERSVCCIQCSTVAMADSTRRNGTVATMYRVRRSTASACISWSLLQHFGSYVGKSVSRGYRAA